MRKIDSPVVQNRRLVDHSVSTWLHTFQLGKFLRKSFSKFQNWFQNINWFVNQNSHTWRLWNVIEIEVRGFSKNVGKYGCTIQPIKHGQLEIFENVFSYLASLYVLLSTYIFWMVSMRQKITLVRTAVWHDPILNNAFVIFPSWIQYCLCHLAK